MSYQPLVKLRPNSPRDLAVEYAVRLIDGTAQLASREENDE